MGKLREGKLLVPGHTAHACSQGSVSSSGMQKRERTLVSGGTLVDSMALVASPTHSINCLYNFAALLDCSNLKKKNHLI